VPPVAHGAAVPLTDVAGRGGGCGIPLEAVFEGGPLLALPSGAKVAEVGVGGIPKAGGRCVAPGRPAAAPPDAQGA
jgi:hypothetical protein